MVNNRSATVDENVENGTKTGTRQASKRSGRFKRKIGGTTAPFRASPFGRDRAVKLAASDLALNAENHCVSVSPPDAEPIAPQTPYGDLPLVTALA